MTNKWLLYQAVSGSALAIASGSAMLFGRLDRGLGIIDLAWGLVVFGRLGVDAFKKAQR